MSPRGVLKYLLGNKADRVNTSIDKILSRLILSLDEELIRAMRELAEWEGKRELYLAAELLQLALDKVKPERETRRQLMSLTERERQILALLHRGYTRRMISETLVLSRNTIKTHLRNLRIKLGLPTIAKIRPFADDLPTDILIQYFKS